ncbi:MAG: HDIG domain-containing protein [Candidatus Omnitrophota bacterium]|nr:HDIG domain-containing protein [Candidatus Omnitrophota bacterium]
MTDTSIKPKTKLSPRRQWLFWTGRVGLYLLAAVLATMMLAIEREPTLIGGEFALGEPAPRTLFSPLTLTYVNEEKMRLRQEDAAEDVAPILLVDSAVADQIGQKLGAFFAAIEMNSSGASEAIELASLELPFDVSDADIRALSDPERLNAARENVEQLLRAALGGGLLSYQTKLELLEQDTAVVVISNGDAATERQVSVRDVLSMRELREAAVRMLPADVTRRRKLRTAILDIFEAVIEPNLSFDRSLTAVRRQATRAAVKDVQETIKKNELIVGRGILVTPDIRLKVEQIQQKLAARKILGRITADSILASLTFMLFFAYLFFFERKMLLNLRMVYLTLSVFLLAIALCKIITVWPGSSPYLMPGALASLLLVLLTRSRLGTVSAVVMAIMTAPLADFHPDIMSAILLAGMVGTFSALRIRRRVQFLQVGLAIGFVTMAVLFAFQLFEGFTFAASLQASGVGLANGLIITALLFLLLPLLEPVFGVTTDITLLELSDLNHPLLKRMIIEAPGTYHHSLVVSRLAESACEAIGANELLARVGCYFHDIGKIARAEFFTENQADKFSGKHEKLAPTMSALIILNHVKDGIELGRKYKLRDTILRFIPEHQGTGIIYYFYRKAIDQAQPGERVDPNDFRYPGPNPQSRETAVALLADSTEAASRSLRDPNAESIRQLVRKIINDKFIDGQLDECDLTLRDLFRIQESFVHNLMAIFHTRVEYPKKPAEDDNPDIFEEGQFQKFRLSP